MNNMQNLTPQQLYQLGIDCYWGKNSHAIDYEKAAEYFSLAAEAGHAESQFALATCYVNGRGVTQEPQKAIDLYILAAEQGHPQAQHNLAWSYETGHGTLTDLEKAAYWYQKAAENGIAAAQFKMAVFCTDALGGVERNYEQAIEWYLLAAAQGYQSAQFNLACCYVCGQGTAPDTDKAIHWYIKAAEQGHVSAQFNLAHTYYYSKDPAVHNYDEAFRWFLRAAEQGYPGAQYMTAVCYTNQHGVARDYKAAIDWYVKAAEQGHVNAQFNLAWCYEQAQGGERDLTKAAHWYKKAAENGHKMAPYYLGMCYIELADHENAVHWLKIAADKGNADAALLLEQETEALKQASQSSESVSQEEQTLTPPTDEQATNQLLLTLDDARMEVMTQPIRRGYLAQVKVVIHNQPHNHLAQQEAEQLSDLSINHVGTNISLGKKIKLDVHLHSPDVTIEESEEVLYWNGRYSVCEFIIEVPSDFPKPQIRLTARIYYEQALLQKTTMIVDLSETHQTYRPTDYKSGSSAFISYAHEDLEKVTGRIQGMWIRDPDYNLFLDIINMRKSEKFEPRLYAEIEKRDLFYLFWSRNAAASEWVSKELDYALKTKGKEAIEIIPLELPDVCPPPKGLEDLNSSNILLYLIKNASESKK